MTTALLRRPTDRRRPATRGGEKISGPDATGCRAWAYLGGQEPRSVRKTNRVDASEFDQFYTASFRRVTIQVHAMIGDLDEAQECTQEAFARAWSHRRDLRKADNPEAWVRTTAHRDRGDQDPDGHLVADPYVRLADAGARRARRPGATPDRQPPAPTTGTCRPTTSPCSRGASTAPPTCSPTVSARRTATPTTAPAPSSPLSPGHRRPCGGRAVSGSRPSRPTAGAWRPSTSAATASAEPRVRAQHPRDPARDLPGRRLRRRPAVGVREVPAARHLGEGQGGHGALRRRHLPTRLGADGRTRLRDGLSRPGAASSRSARTSPWRGTEHGLDTRSVAGGEDAPTGVAGD